MTIGLVNNMPDAALLATERQFTRCCLDAAPADDVRIRTVLSARYRARRRRARAACRRAMRRSTSLPHAGIDALIVTGCEPVRPPCGRALLGQSRRRWSTGPSTTRSRRSGPASRPTRRFCISTVWSASCRANARACMRSGRSPIIRCCAAFREPAQVPHSRLNGLSA